MFELGTIEFLESGCALIVGFVTPEGDPWACRGWGVTVLPDRDGQPVVRLLLSASDGALVGALDPAAPIAITGADVPTLRSIQLKGTVAGVDLASDPDRARAQAFIDAFFSDIVETDGTARELLERLVPSDFTACTVVVDEHFDQTPGPGAGAPMAAIDGSGR